MFPRWLIESGLGADAVKHVLDGDEPPATANHQTLQQYWDQPVSVDQIRDIAARSQRRFWLCGDWVREQPLSISDVTARKLTADRSHRPGRGPREVVVQREVARARLGPLRAPPSNCLTRHIRSVRYVCSVHTGGGKTWAR
jgi:hypothetical protein